MWAEPCGYGIGYCAASAVGSEELGDSTAVPPLRPLIGASEEVVGPTILDGRQPMIVWNHPRGQ